MTSNREPDLSTFVLDLLHILNGTTPTVTEAREMASESEIDMRPMATLSWKLYSAFVDVGFTQKQAFDLVVEVIKYTLPAPGTND